VNRFAREPARNAPPRLGFPPAPIDAPMPEDARAAQPDEAEGRACGAPNVVANGRDFNPPPLFPFPLPLPPSNPYLLYPLSPFPSLNSRHLDTCLSYPSLRLNSFICPFLLPPPPSDHSARPAGRRAQSHALSPGEHVLCELARPLTASLQDGEAPHEPIRIPQ